MNISVTDVSLLNEKTSRHKIVNASLNFRKSGRMTYLSHQHTPHPFHITRPFHLESDPDGMATLYLQSSAGGLYHDDEHDLTIDIENDAMAHVTSQASTIIHAAKYGETRLTTKLNVGENAWLEFCPDPAILFSKARLRNMIKAQVHSSSRLILCDAQLSHDPDKSDGFFDYFENEISIQHEESAPFYIDRVSVRGEDWLAATADYPCCGTFLVFDANFCEAIGLAIKGCIESFDPNEIYAGQSSLPDRSLVVIRLIAKSGADLTFAMGKLWQSARFAMTDSTAKLRKK